MVSNAMSPPDIGGNGDGNGLYYECSNLRVSSNLQAAEIMLYTGQLLLIQSGSKKAKSIPSQRSHSRRTVRISPTNIKSDAGCSKMFSALKVADLEFNSSSTTCITTAATAGNTTTNTTATASAAVKTSTSKSQRAASPSINFTSNSAWSSKSPSSFSFDGANDTCKTAPSKSPFAATTSQPKLGSKAAPSSEKLNNAPPPFKGSKKRDNPIRVSFSKDKAEGDGDRFRGGNTGALFASSLEDQFKASAANGSKIAPVKKVNLLKEDEAQVDSRGADQIRKHRIKEESSNSLAKELLQAQLRCFQIQHSLYQVLVATLRNKESMTELQAASQMSRAAESEDYHSLLLPLETLLRCSDIQLGLHHSLNVALDNKAGRFQDDGADSPGYNSQAENIGRMIYDKDELLIESRSLMNHTKFAQSLVCFHLMNPYSPNPRYACGEERIFNGDSLFGNLGYYLPNGEGKLVSFKGHLIYEGQWKKGKRWGHGKAFIFSGTDLSASKQQYGIYEGQWWNNMRHGHGRLVFASCTVYEGEWQYDLMSGVGAMHSPDGSVLEGLWDEDEPCGCGMFTWPNGSVEYREYQNGQVVRVLESPEETRKISPLNEVMREYSILRLKYQIMEEDKTRLVQAEARMRAQQSRAENSKLAKVKELRGEFTKLLQKGKKKMQEKYQEDLKEMNESHDKKIKDLEEKIRQIEKELDHKKSDLLCQICFERYRDCILKPCSHLLYCQVCIAKLHADGSARCPACRGSIHSQINCSLNQ